MGDSPKSGVNVLLVADPGLPTARARSIQEDLQELLDEAFSPPDHSQRPDRDATSAAR